MRSIKYIKTHKLFNYQEKQNQKLCNSNSGLGICALFQNRSKAVKIISNKFCLQIAELYAYGKDAECMCVCVIKRRNHQPTTDQSHKYRHLNIKSMRYDF